MKKIARKNQIVITALAVMIAVAGYLNFTGQDISKNGLKNASRVANATVAPAAETKAPEARKASTSTSKKTTTDISAQDNGKDEGYTVADNGELKSASKENPGEAVMVSNTLGSDYFESAKLTREQNRAKNKETLMQIINNDKIASKDKQSAIDQVASMTKDSQMESAAELMLQAKGFDDAVVSIGNKKADVVVNADKLTPQQIAQIEDIVKRKTNVAGENIVITPVSVKEK